MTLETPRPHGPSANRPDPKVKPETMVFDLELPAMPSLAIVTPAAPRAGETKPSVNKEMVEKLVEKVKGL